jgi:hypothetical protein
MKLSSILTTISVVCLLVCAVQTIEAAPAFKGQPRINQTLRHLNVAQKQVATSTSDALVSLEAAVETMSVAKKNKGTFQPLARTHTERAIRHLKAGEVAAAQEDIAQAIVYANKAGELGAD